MAREDATLQELIVRALTGMDARARQSLDSAAARDPQLRQFCAELDEVVNLLAGSKDWRAETPSAELTAKVRRAVAEKLPSAPPHFRKVLIDEDLGRGEMLRKLTLGSAGALILLLVLAWMWFSRTGGPGPLKLDGRVIFEAPLKDGSLAGWARAGDGAWQSGPDGLRVEGGDDPSAYFLQNGFDVSEPLAFVIDVSVPSLDSGSNVVVFLAEGAGGAQPVFRDGFRPARALALEIGRDGLLLSGANGAPLQSRPLSNAAARFYRLRLELLGQRARVLMNDEIFFDGPLAHPPRGALHAGVRVAGPQKSEVRFNAARLER